MLDNKKQLDYQRKIILEELMCDDCYYKNNCKIQCEPRTSVTAKVKYIGRLPKRDRE